MISSPEMHQIAQRTLDKTLTGELSWLPNADTSFTVKFHKSSLVIAIVRAKPITYTFTALNDNGDIVGKVTSNERAGVHEKLEKLYQFVESHTLQIDETLSDILGGLGLDRRAIAERPKMRLAAD